MRIVRRACLAWIVLCLLPTVGGGQVVYWPVALSGEPAPGIHDTFLRFSNPVINALGDVAFQANLAGPTTDVVPHGVWSGSRGSLRAVAIAGQEAPDTGGARFRTPGWPIILTSDGQVMFYANLANEGGVTSENDYGIGGGSAEGLRVLARRPDPAPGVPAGFNYSLFFASPHSSGAVGLSASLSGPNNNSAAWVGSLNSLAPPTLIALSGDEAPGLPVGSHFTGLGTPAVNASGMVALAATATEAGLPAVQRPGIWAGQADDLRVVAFAGGAAPGAGGRRFDFFTGPQLNNAGQVAFWGFLESDSDDERLSDVGIWAGAAEASAIHALALEGQQAPGLNTGVVFRGSAPGDEVTYDPFGNPVLGGGGHVAFAATVFGDGVDFDHNDGVWVSEPVGASAAPNLTLVAREGDHPPGTPLGTRFVGIFSGDDLISAFERPSLNSAGQVAFEALTTGPLGEFGRGIWATDAAGVLRLVAHTGDDFLVAPGDVREIALLKLHAGGSSEHGELSPLNDAGQLAFAVSFADGSEGVFVATIVPEPTVISLLVVLVSSGAVYGRHLARFRESWVQ